jgi:hypothetical protein
MFMPFGVETIIVLEVSPEEMVGYVDLKKFSTKLL